MMENDTQDYYEDDEFEPIETDEVTGYDIMDDDYYWSMKLDIDRLSDQIRSDESDRNV